MQASNDPVVISSVRDAQYQNYVNPATVNSYIDSAYHKVRIHVAAAMAQKQLLDTAVPHGPVYEIACGGHSMLASVEASGRSIIGTDLARQSLEEGIRTGRLSATLQFDATKPWPIATASAGMVASGEFIEHMYDPEVFFAESNRILAPGGVLLVTTPNLLTLQDRLRVFAGRPPRQVKATNTGADAYLHGHIRPFTRHSLRAVYEAHGFRVIGFASNFVGWQLPSGKWLESRWLARLFPGLGGSLIMMGCKTRGLSGD
jgi:2-polyprenyl-3-methyl-5-hydroxy-6-metoxy-1,4-benzoquinol methylase